MQMFSFLYSMHLCVVVSRCKFTNTKPNTNHFYNGTGNYKNVLLCDASSMPLGVNKSSKQPV